MAVLGLLSVTLEVPDLDAGIKFYTDAGLEVTRAPEQAVFRCTDQDRDCLTLLQGSGHKRLHHIRLRAEALSDMVAKAVAGGGQIVLPPDRCEDNGLWVRDPHGMLINLSEQSPDPPLSRVPSFEINAPGRMSRLRRSAILPRSSYRSVRPRRLGHVLVFTPDVLRSVAFMTEALGMGLADRAQDVVAFCCATRDSEHHVVAFAKSPGIGFHHASFQVNDPDEVGRAGRALVEKTGRGDWGFGRHTIGSNFFHYIQDPWGSWFEYYSDMDFIDDYALWSPTNYDLDDSLASWGPAVPHDFVHNYEADS
jgi:catechol 2,3-dioxygenase-like lactoylglutathione lyase family enzyme